MTRRTLQAIDRLADLPAHIAARLADEIRGIWVGPGRGPSRALTASATCAAGRSTPTGLGGTRSASYDVTLHKIGHALDHIDQMSASTGFAALHSLCRSALADPFYRDRPAELFAEGFALVFTQYPAVLVSLMSGNEARAEVHGLTSADTA